MSWKKLLHLAPRWKHTKTEAQERKGEGSAQADTKIEDISTLAKAVVHYKVSKKIDTYFGIGFGVSFIKYLFSNYTNGQGITQSHHYLDNTLTHKITQLVYEYNDFNHVKWENSTGTRFAMAAYIGARYYFNDHYAINIQAGLPTVAIKKKEDMNFNDYNFFMAGVSYKF